MKTVTVCETTYVLAPEQRYDERTGAAIDKGSGQKIWECSLDLCRALHQIDLSGISNVLELGCGHGLPGITCLKRSNAHVTFQDYISETIDQITRPSVALNTVETDSRVYQTSFIASSWSAFADQLKYDLILCSEGIYSTEHFSALKQILGESLTVNGMALFAGKKYYFGCGGGTMEFSNFLGEDFECVTFEKIEDKKSNIREILMIRKRKED